jgi:signal peptidase II
MLYAILAVALIIVDQVTKYLTRAHIELGESLPFIPRVLELTYIKNTGAAFSILEKHTWLLSVVSAIIVVVVVWLVIKKFFTNWIGMLSATLIVAGGIGNLIDRVALRYVTDMIKTIFMDFPVFNFADCCITVGVVLLVIYVLFFYTEEKKEENHGTDLPADRQ